MGNGGGKKKQIVQPPVEQERPYVPNEDVKIPSAPQSPHLSSPRPSVRSHHSASVRSHHSASVRSRHSPSVRSRHSPSVRSPAPSERSRASAKRSVTALTNGTDRRPTFRELDNNSGRESNDVQLPLINNHPLSGTKSRSSARVLSGGPQPPIGQSPTGSNSLSGHHKHSHRQSSGALHGQIGRCSHCPHCQRAIGRSVASTPKPKWISENHGLDEGHIVMDQYDAVAVKKKIIADNGHLPGSYDYRPYLTMEQTYDYDQTKENYYTLPVLATTKPPPTVASHTPFPEYSFLQRREQRVNKPYSLPLFD